MTTLSGVRSRVRLRLEESAPGIWSDAELDEAISSALDEYNAFFPLEATADLIAQDGDSDLALPTGTRAVLRVTLADGWVVPRRGTPVGRTSDEQQAWEMFGGELHFSRPLTAGTVSIWYLRDHAIDDVPDGDAGLLVAGAVWRALQQRAVQDAKRGFPSTVAYDLVLRHAESEHRQMLDARRRRVRALIP